jgi:hypothetical protein
MSFTETYQTITRNPFVSNMPSLIGGLGNLYIAHRQMNMPDIDYDVLNLKADQRDIEAKQVELQVKQDANELRRQFVQAMGEYQYGASKRGVKVGEGSAGENIERSSIDLGKDVQEMETEAGYKTKQLRMDADRLRKAGDGAKEVNKLQREATALGYASEALSSFGDYAVKVEHGMKQTGTTRIPAKKSTGGVVKETARARFAKTKKSRLKADLKK